MLFYMRVYMEVSEHNWHHGVKRKYRTTDNTQICINVVHILDNMYVCVWIIYTAMVAHTHTHTNKTL